MRSRCMRKETAMVNRYPARNNQFVALSTSSHGRLTVVEPQTPTAEKFLTCLGFRPGAVAVEYGDLRELRYAAREAGLSIN